MTQDRNFYRFLGRFCSTKTLNRYVFCFARFCLNNIQPRQPNVILQNSLNLDFRSFRGNIKSPLSQSSFQSHRRSGGARSRVWRRSPLCEGRVGIHTRSLGGPGWERGFDEAHHR